MVRLVYNFLGIKFSQQVDVKTCKKKKKKTQVDAFSFETI